MPDKEAASELVDLVGVGFIELSTNPSDPSATIVGKGRDVTVSLGAVDCAFNAPKTTSFMLRTKDVRVANDVIIPLAVSTVPVYFRIGVEDFDGFMYWWEWEEHYITGYKLHPPRKNEVVELTVFTNDFLTLWQGANRLISRSGSTSSIAGEIAKYYGMEKRSFIEESSVSGEWLQSGQSDLDFLLKRMMPRSMNKDGIGGYVLYAKQDNFFFCTPSYTSAQGQYLSNLWVIPYSAKTKGGSPTHNTIVQEYKYPRAYNAGGNGYSLSVCDPYNPPTFPSASEYRDNAVRLGEYTPERLQGEGKTPKPYHIGVNGEKEAQAIAQHVYADSARFTFDLAIRIVNNIQPKLGDYVYFASDGPSNGLYLVNFLRVSYEDGSLTSFLGLSRGHAEISDDGAAYADLTKAGYNLLSRLPEGTESLTETARSV